MESLVRSPSRFASNQMPMGSPPTNSARNVVDCSVPRAVRWRICPNQASPRMRGVLVAPDCSRVIGREAYSRFEISGLKATRVTSLAVARACLGTRTERTATRTTQHRRRRIIVKPPARQGRAIRPCLGKDVRLVAWMTSGILDAVVRALNGRAVAVLAELRISARLSIRGRVTVGDRELTKHDEA